jgi:superoxide dismutase, Cu-Zn family
MVNGCGKRGLWIGGVVACAMLSGCGDDSSSADMGRDLTAAALMAKATINEPGGAQGTVTFEDTASGTKITISLTAVPGDGNHGMHIHQTNDCADTTGDGGIHHGASGGHFNPAMVNHGCPPANPHHAGDLGNIMITGGAGTATVTTTDLTVAAGNNSVVNRAFILHANPDDCMSQPVGNAGGRIGCGPITAL